MEVLRYPVIIAHISAVSTRWKGLQALHLEPAYLKQLSEFCQLSQLRMLLAVTANSIRSSTPDILPQLNIHIIFPGLDITATHWRFKIRVVLNLDGQGL